MGYNIENDKLKISVASHGAELQSIFDKESSTEYMWSGDPKFWGKRSPVLFPIVGTLKNDTYYYNHNSYHLPRHGFARQMDFTLVERSESHLLFSLKSNTETLEAYPFEFEFQIKYELDNNAVSVTYKVINTGQEKSYFSVGGHPAFKVPIFDGDVYDDYSLIFNKDEDADKWPISKDGLIELEPAPFLKSSNKIRLNKSLFYKDAIVLKNLRSDNVKLVNDKNKGIEFSFPDFPSLGIWAAKDADFVCIEPWCGIADSVDTNQALVNKEGINELEAGQDFDRSWKVKII